MRLSIALNLLLLPLAMGCGPGEPPGQPVTGTSEVNALPDATGQPVVDAENWSTWRGPNRNGVSVDQNPVTNWSENQNVIWKSPVPGRGHSSPTIFGGRIFLTTADRTAGTQSVLCYDQASGETLWNKTLFEGGLTSRIHPNNSHASPSVAADGQSVFCVFINDGRVMLTRLDLDGNLLWQKELGKFQCDYGFGFGASPIFWNGRLIVSAESSVDPFIQCLDPESGELVWRIDRKANTSFSTPVIAEVAGKHQLLISGSQALAAYDPETGKELWSVPAQWQVTCGTVVWDGEMAFASGGYPAPQTIGVKADGSAEMVWENNQKCYEQSLLAVDGVVYGLTDSGICHCWDAATGEVRWRERMRPKVSASPVLAGGHLYFTTEDGSCFVIRHNPNAFELVATNKLGDSAFATPTFVDDRIYLRVGEGAGANRQEWLYCIGKAGG